MAEAAPRLYLTTPPLTEAARFAADFEAALAAGDVACVLLRLAPLPPGELKKIVGTLLPLAQARGAAVLLEDPQLAMRCAADGVHVRGLGALEPALATMKSGKSAEAHKIVGIGGLATRHDAMVAGESDVDYIMFGDDTQAEDLVERVGWWAEIFTVPCVAFARSLDDVAPLAAAGADFIALGDAVWRHDEGPAAAVAAAMRALGLAHEPVR